MHGHTMYVEDDELDKSDDIGTIGYFVLATFLTIVILIGDFFHWLGSIKVKYAGEWPYLFSALLPIIGGALAIKLLTPWPMILIPLVPLYYLLKRVFLWLQSLDDHLTTDQKEALLEEAKYGGPQTNCP